MGSVCAYNNPGKLIYANPIIKVPQEEISVKTSEDNCLFKLKHVENILEVFNLEMNSTTLNYSQCKKILCNLGFMIEDLENPETPIFAFISSFKYQEIYPKLDLMVACVLLSGSRLTHKINALFDIFDTKSQEILKKDKISNMLRLIYKTSTYNCLFLAVGRNGSLEIKQIEAYTTFYAIYEERFVNEFIIIILMDNKKITKNTFTEIICKNFYSFLVFPSGVREYAFANYIN
ncbi:hypothetical protein SteCoe_31444 [Stentor coeruleus]|uniref:Uncharacterized protein n=1 Tax=Stentor coeruleus TaxID=5963 RepID=A0A1R2B174_9CILI|nr:hypothetical protein SteCoe_31444 [Stentor coeruleus]